MTNTNNAARMDIDEDFLEEDAAILTPRIQLLKNKADRLGIPYSPNIGEDTLARRIEEHLEGSQGLEVETAPEEAEMTQQQRRVAARKAASKLVLVNVHPIDPMRIQLRGEYVVSGNLAIGTITKYIPFGTTKGYYIPQILLDILLERTYTHFNLRKDQYGNDIPYPVQKPAYSIQILPDLTQKEIDKIADRQRASLDWENEQDNMGH